MIGMAMYAEPFLRAIPFRSHVVFSSSGYRCTFCKHSSHVLADDIKFSIAAAPAVYISLLGQILHWMRLKPGLSLGRPGAAFLRRCNKAWL